MFVGDTIHDIAFHVFKKEKMKEPKITKIRVIPI